MGEPGRLVSYTRGMPFLGRVAFQVVGLLVASMLVAGPGWAAAPNGIESKAPDEIVTAALAAGSSTRSAWVHGGGVSGGEKIALDIHIGSRGGRGHISANGLSFDFIRIGSTAYFRGGIAFWRKAAGPSGAALAPLFAGKWMKVKSARQSPLKSLVSLTDLPELLHGILADHGPLTTEGLTTFGGLPAVAIRDSADGGLLYVAATGQPYPRGIVGSGSSSSKGTIRFERWNQPLEVKAPKKSVDLTRYIK